MPAKTIFAIPGSLRAGSSNHNILKYLATLAPAGINFTVYDGLAAIPPFDPGNDNENPPEPVTELRNFIANADAVIICTPEYAYGVPGQLKNALDWLVSSASFDGKTTSLTTASTGGENAHAAMLLILRAINANRVEDATLLIPFIRSKMDSEGNISDRETAESLKKAFDVLLDAI